MKTPAFSFTRGKKTVRKHPFKLREPDSNQAQNMVFFSLKSDQPGAAVSNRETDFLTNFGHTETISGSAHLLDKRDVL